MEAYCSRGTPFGAGKGALFGPGWAALKLGVHQFLRCNPSEERITASLGRQCLYPGGESGVESGVSGGVEVVPEVLRRGVGTQC